MPLNKKCYSNPFAAQIIYKGDRCAMKGFFCAERYEFGHNEGVSSNDGDHNMSDLHEWVIVASKKRLMIE